MVGAGRIRIRHRHITHAHKPCAVAVVAQLRIVALEGAAGDVHQLTLIVRLVDRHAAEAGLILVILRGPVLVGAAADVHRAAVKRVHAAAVLAVDHHGHAVYQVQRRAAAHRHQADAVRNSDAAGCAFHNTGAVNGTVLDRHRAADDIERAPVAAGVCHGDRLAAQVDGDGLSGGVHIHALRQRIGADQIHQQRHGLAVLGCRDRVRQRLVVRFANLGYVGALLHAIGYGFSVVCAGDVAFRAVFFGNGLGECTAGDSDLGIINHLERTVDGTTSDA